MPKVPTMHKCIICGLCSFCDVATIGMRLIGGDPLQELPHLSIDELVGCLRERGRVGNGADPSCTEMPPF